MTDGGGGFDAWVVGCCEPRAHEQTINVRNAVRAIDRIIGMPRVLVLRLSASLERTMQCCACPRASTVSQLSASLPHCGSVEPDSSRPDSARHSHSRSAA